MLPKQIMFILDIFNILEFFTESSKKHKKLIFFVFYFLLVGFFLYAYHMFRVSITYKFLEVLNLSLQYCILLITYCLVIIDSAIQQQEQRDFWRIYKKIYYSYHSNPNYFAWQSFVFKFIVFNAMTFLFFVRIFFTCWPMKFFIFSSITLVKILDV